MQKYTHIGIHILLFQESAHSHFSVYVYTYICVYVYISIDMRATTFTGKRGEKKKEKRFWQVLVCLLHKCINVACHL